jgi:hypothetical protein
MAETNGIEHQEERSQSNMGVSKTGRDGSPVTPRAGPMISSIYASRQLFQKMRARRHSSILARRGDGVQKDRPARLQPGKSRPIIAVRAAARDPAPPAPPLTAEAP